MLADKINSGLSKLFTAKEDVGTMKIELQQKNVDLEEAQKMSEKLLKEISASTAVAEKEKAASRSSSRASSPRLTRLTPRR